MEEQWGCSEGSWGGNKAQCKWGHRQHSSDKLTVPEGADPTLKFEGNERMGNCRIGSDF